ncbi:unnamed protein product [Chrysoparadoxa australica]
MPVRLRLQRFGRKDRAFYRIVSADSRAPRDGKFLDILGTFNPLPNKHGMKEVRINAERVRYCNIRCKALFSSAHLSNADSSSRYWIGVGAQPSERVGWLLSQFNILPRQPQHSQQFKHIPKAVSDFTA